MLQFVQQSLFDSPAQTLVNTVNTVGVMGKGIAKEFKQRYPKMFVEYRTLCDKHQLIPGALHLWRGPDKWVLNFPTKTTWKKASKIEYIEEGLATFRDNYTRLGIRSIAFPPLGCGNGNLNWAEVKPLMVRYLCSLDIPVWIHEKHVASSFQPEQDEFFAKRAPASYDEFKSDLRAIALERKGRFQHFVGNWHFQAEFSAIDSQLHIYLDGEYILPDEYIELAWIGLQLGVLTLEHFGEPVSQRFGGYLLPLIQALPYVKPIGIRKESGGIETLISGLYIVEATGLGFDEYQSKTAA